VNTPARLDSLPAIERACWMALAAAAHDRAHPWRVLTLATVDGEAADARSLVLRDADDLARTLTFYTDARSAKVQQLAAHPLGMLVGWWPQAGWQLRLAVQLAVETDGLDVSSRWARVKLSPTAQDYMAALPPGTPVTSHSPERGTRAHFAVLTASVTRMDWLELHPLGHRRALLAGESSRWLTP
jgi:pyridoxamine 5'-phosphate oxidase